MNEYLTRLLTAIESVAESLETLAGVAGNPPTAPGAEDATSSSTDEPPKRRRRTKAEMEAARAAEEAARAAEEAEAEPPKAEPPKAAPPNAEPIIAAPAFDYAVLKANVIKLATKFGDVGKKNAINLLAEYGVAKADQADPEVWPEMNAKFEAAIATLEEPKAAEDFA